jgi:protein-tyrosine phosphatase
MLGAMSTAKRRETGEHAADSVPPPRNPAGPYRICMVCLGNICRSPTAEVVLRDELRKAGLDGRVVVDSAGLGDWHLREPMHPSTRAELSRHGLDGSGHRARQIERSWLPGYDLLIAMDRRNLAGLQRLAAGHDDFQDRIQLMRSFDPDSEPDAEVPDPYEGRPDDFVLVYELVAAAARGLARQLADTL